jgi:hypothetical protein
MRRSRTRSRTPVFHLHSQKGILHYAKTTQSCTAHGASHEPAHRAAQGTTPLTHNRPDNPDCTGEPSRRQPSRTGWTATLVA